MIEQSSVDWFVEENLHRKHGFYYHLFGLSGFNFPIQFCEILEELDYIYIKMISMCITNLIMDMRALYVYTIMDNGDH